MILKPFLPHNKNWCKSLSPSALASLLCSSCCHRVSSWVPAWHLLACRGRRRHSWVRHSWELQRHLWLEWMTFLRHNSRCQSVCQRNCLTETEERCHTIWSCSHDLHDCLCLPRQDHHPLCMAISDRLTLPLSSPQMEWGNFFKLLRETRCIYWKRELQQHEINGGRSQSVMNGVLRPGSRWVCIRARLINRSASAVSWY